MSWITQPLGGATPAHRRCSFLKGFLDWGRRHGTLPGLSRRRRRLRGGGDPSTRPLPEFIPEFVMAQLETEANLAGCATRPSGTSSSC